MIIIRGEYIYRSAFVLVDLDLYFYESPEVVSAKTELKDGAGSVEIRGLSVRDEGEATTARRPALLRIFPGGEGCDAQ